MKLTNAAVKAARPTSRAYKLADDRGLFLFVAPSGLRSYRFKFRYQGREKLMTIGNAGDISLAQARDRRDAARAQLRDGVDPTAKAVAITKRTGPLDTFEPLARAWHEARRSRWSTVHADDVIASLELHVFPALGRLELSDIDAPAVLDLLQVLEARGSHETARRVRQRIAAVFGFAITRKLTRDNPAAIIADELEPRPAAKLQPALIVIEDARELLDAAERVAAAPAIKLASRLVALTAVRLAVARGATWCEFEGIDWTSDFVGPLQPLWRIPAARMKLKKAKKADPINEHLVPLSRQAVDVLRAARALAPAGELVFPGRCAPRPIGEAAIGDLYARAGFAGRHVPHGWRATYSTILNERRPSDRAAIDQALAHLPKKGPEVSKVEGAYNRARHLALRRELFQYWADILVD